MRPRLFCFPYAGGGPGVFRGWRLASAEIVPVVYPGRATRLGEEPLRSISALALDAEAELLPAMREPFAFFGYSMGAFVAFELARRLASRGAALPRMLLVAAAASPVCESREPVIHDLGDAEMREELRRAGGTPAEVLDHDELMTLMLPMLRADFEAAATYRYEAGAPLDVPIATFGGVDDESVTPEELARWCESTSRAFSASILPGDHFFIQAPDDLLRATDACLRRQA